MRVTFCTDLDKSVVITNCEKRGWIQVGPEDDWNVYWAGTLSCRSLFSVDSGYRMHDNQYDFILILYLFFNFLNKLSNDSP